MAANVSPWTKSPKADAAVTASADLERGRASGEATEHRGRQQSIAREVTPIRRAGDAARGTAAGEQVGKRRLVGAQRPAVFVDHETALRMEEGAGDFHRLVG